MDVLEQMSDDLPVAAACRVLGASRATLYRTTSRSLPPAPPAPRSPPRKLSQAEREQVLATMHLERFVDQPPAEVYGALLSEGIFLCSVRTMVTPPRAAYCRAFRSRGTRVRGGSDATSRRARPAQRVASME